MIKTEGSFEKTLAKGWVTSDILSESISKMTDKTRGLSDEQLTALGYTRAQVTSLEALDAGVKDGSVSLEDFAKKMTMVSGRENLISALRNSFNGLMAIIKPIKEAFSEIFPPITGEQLYAITERIKELTEKFKIGEETALKIKETFKGLFAILDIGRKVFMMLANGVGALIKAVFPAGDGLLSLTSYLGNYITKINSSITNTTIFSDVVTKIGENISKAFEKIAGVTDKLTPIFYALATVAGKVFKVISDCISKILLSLDMGNIVNLANGGLLAMILVGFKKFIGNLTKITENGSGMFAHLKDILDGVRGSLEAYQQQLKAGVIMKIAIAIGILAASILVIASIDPVKLASSLAAISILFAELFGSMAIFENAMGAKGFKTIGKVSRAMIALSISVLILSFAMTKLASLDWEGLGKGMIGIAFILKALLEFLEAIPKDKIVEGASKLILLSVALLILATSVKSLSTLSWEGLAKGLGGFIIILWSLLNFLESMPKDKIVEGASKLVLLSAALLLMATSVKLLATLSWEELAKGLSGFVIILYVLLEFLKGLPKDKIMEGSFSLVILASSLLILAASVKSLSALSWEELAKGLSGMVITLWLLLTVLKAMPKDPMTPATALFVISSALIALAIGLKNNRKHTFDRTSKGSWGPHSNIDCIWILIPNIRCTCPNDDDVSRSTSLVRGGIPCNRCRYASILSRLNGIIYIRNRRSCSFSNHYNSSYRSYSSHSKKIS